MISVLIFGFLWQRDRVQQCTSNEDDIMMMTMHTHSWVEWGWWPPGNFRRSGVRSRHLKAKATNCSEKEHITYCNRCSGWCSFISSKAPVLKWMNFNISKKFLGSPCFSGHISDSKDVWHSNPTAKNHIVVNFHDPSHTLNFVTYLATIQEILATKWDKMVPSKERVTRQENLRRRFRPSLLMGGRAEAGQRLINFSPEKLIEL